MNVTEYSTYTFTKNPEQTKGRKTKGRERMDINIGGGILWRRRLLIGVERGESDTGLGCGYNHNALFTVYEFVKVNK